MLSKGISTGETPETTVLVSARADTQWGKQSMVGNGMGRNEKTPRGGVYSRDVSIVAKRRIRARQASACRYWNPYVSSASYVDELR